MGRQSGHFGFWHMALTYLIKNQSIGVVSGALHILVWIF